MKYHPKSVAALFDMDGVIVHTNPYHKKAFDIFLNKYNVSLTNDELKDHIYGRTNEEIFPYIFKEDFTPQKGKQWADEKETMFRELYKGHIEPVAGLLPFLKELKENNVPVAVGTSAPIENLNFVMDELNLRGWFDTLLHSADVTKGKPDPEIYLKAAERLQVPPGNCVVLEDSIAGLNAGLNAGMKVVAVTTTHEPEEFEGAHLIISDFKGFTVQHLLDLF